jgi:glutathione S-transferase
MVLKVLSTTPVEREDIESQWNEIFDKESGILVFLEERLGKTQTFICGDTFTVADIAIYCELVTVMMLSQQTAEDLRASNLPKTYAWYSKLGDFTCFNELNAKLSELINQH